MNSSKVNWNEDSYDDVGDNYLEEEEVEKTEEEEEVEKTEEEEEVMKTEGEEKVEKIEEVESSLSVSEFTAFKKGDVYQGHSGIVAGTTPKMVYITIISDELSEHKVRILRTSIRHSMGSNSSTFL